MTMTDPIADMLTRIRNANTAMHDSVKMPSSKLKESLAVILRARGLHRGVRRGCIGTGRAGCSRSSSSTPRTGPAPSPGSSACRRPGLRIYARADGLPRVLGGMGVAVVSTSHGLMTDREARQKRVGGEVLCYVW